MLISGAKKQPLEKISKKKWETDGHRDKNTLIGVKKMIEGRK